ncbi:hypothetical protein [Geobacter sp. SVR]|uniref:hypothetical protein n=1 Tax=Geobacter sp. SVR TaxID=2495594 RepID=UPI00143EF4E6|nr:hypothetical protein [Geobacter sp. SVR]BCS52147.1 hypothetical protein GSVR_04550 [Geobacter sp. SVR]GCF86602.1 hypothetical protein GSbR_32020 [Geobacter sp. SVR]
MNLGRIMAAASAIVALMSGMAMATPSTQIWIPSPDVKGFKDIHIDVDNYMRFSSKSDAGPNYYNLGVSAGVLPSENVKLEIGADMLMSSLQNDNTADNHPFYLNAKLGTPEDAFGIKGLPAFAIGAYNLGLYDKPERAAAVAGDVLSTRQNIVYGLVGKTLPVIGRLSAGGYYGSERALSTSGNPKNNNYGVMASWDRSMPEISDKLWLAVDYMSGNNANGEVSVGGSWTFSKQISLLVGAVFFNPFYNVSAGDGGALPGGKPALTTQLDISF